MGSCGRDDENPEHLVSLKGYYIDKYEVTNLQYKEFVQVTGHRSPCHWRNNTFPDARLADHPVVNVSWDDAKAHCDWVQKRLPSEVEWERAVLDDVRDEYAWRGSSNADYANFDNPDGKTTPVDRYPNRKSGLGAWDMCGNVSEWVNDWYDDKYYQTSPESDPKGPDGGHQKCHRGGDTMRPEWESVPRAVTWPCPAPRRTISVSATPSTRSSMRRPRHSVGATRRIP